MIHRNVRPHVIINKVACHRTERNTGGLYFRYPHLSRHPLLSGLVHPISVLEFNKDEVDESTIVSTYNVPQQNGLKKHHNIIEHRTVVSLASRGSSRINLRRHWPGGGWPRYGSGWHTIIGHHFFLDSGGGSALLSLYVCITRLQARTRQKGTQSVSAA